MISIVSILEKALTQQTNQLLFCSNKVPRIRSGKLWTAVGENEIKAATLRSMLFEIIDSDQRDALLAQKKLSSQIFVQNQWVQFTASLHQGGLDISFSWLPTQAAAFWPQNVFLGFLKPASLHLISGPSALDRKFLLKQALQEILPNKNVRVAAFLNESMDEVAGVGSLSVYDRSQLSDFVQQSDIFDLLIVDHNNAKETELVLELAEQGQSVIALLPRTESAKAVQSLIYEHDHPVHIRWRLSQVFQSALAAQLLPSNDGGFAVACDHLQGNAVTRKFLLDEKWAELVELQKTSGDRTQMRSMNQSLLQLLTKRKIEMKTAFEFTSDPDDLDQLLKKVGI